ncbi:MAG: NUDIX domain-containing protein [Chloroflexi bacterium]|nr:NUDIX domain-containing protein [Chloroflexota bacterium]
MSRDSVLRDGDLVFDDGEAVAHGGSSDVPQITRLAAYGVIERDGSLLLCHVSPGNLGAGLWTLPGGGLDFGEAPDAGAIREVEEETGLVAEIVGEPVIHSDVVTLHRRSGEVRLHHVRFVYPMSIVGGEERLEVDGSTDAFEWVPIADVRERGLGDLVERILE